MSSGLILDASTAILLAKIGLLEEIVGRGSVRMTETAAAEALAKDTDDARIIRALIAERRIERVRVTADVEGLMRDFRIERGEAETIALARERGGICGTDDGPAIRCCRVQGIAFTSAIGLLVALVEARRVEPTLGLELLSKLEHFGRYGPRILDDVAARIRSLAPGSGGASR